MTKLSVHLRSAFFLRNLAILVPLSFLAGHLIVGHDRDETFGELLATPGYLLSVGCSATIALWLLVCIYMASYKLNQKYGGNGLNRYWLCGQLLYGVLGVIIVELILATILFKLMGYWILDTAYFKKLFGPIVMFVLLVNLGYIVFYLNRRSIVKIRYKFLDNKVKDREGGNLSNLRRPAFFYSDNRVVKCVDFAYNVSFWRKSLTRTMVQLDRRDYFRGSRDWIIHRSIIISVEHLNGNRLCVNCRLENDFQLEVSRRNVAAFKEWFGTDR